LTNETRRRPAESKKNTKIEPNKAANIRTGFGGRGTDTEHMMSAVKGLCRQQQGF